MTTQSKAWLYCANVYCVSHWTGADSAPRSQPEGVTALAHQGSRLNWGGAEAGEKEGSCHGRGELRVTGQASQGRAVLVLSWRHWGGLPRRSDTELLLETHVFRFSSLAPQRCPLCYWASSRDFYLRNEKWVVSQLRKWGTQNKTQNKMRRASLLWPVNSLPFSLT